MSEPVHRITSLGNTAPREPGPDVSAGPPPYGTTQETPPGIPPHERAEGLERGIDRLLAIQRPVVVAHLRAIRRTHPTSTPDELIRILERRYLTAVTTGGAAVGATAVVPGIGTGVTLALSGVETAAFLEATALFAQSIAEVHGMHVDNPERARALVMTLMLGREGVDLVRQFAAQATGTGAARNVYWGEVITNGLPKAVMSTVVDRLRHVFLRQFAVKGGAGIVGKAIPFGIGAAIGGAGNHILGRRVLRQSRQAFGGAPAVLPFDLEPREGDSVLRSAGTRMSRGGVLIGGAVATATSRGIRAVGRAVRPRRRGGEIEESQPDAPTMTPTEADAPSPQG